LAAINGSDERMQSGQRCCNTVGAVFKLRPSQFWVFAQIFLAAWEVLVVLEHQTLFKDEKD